MSPDGPGSPGNRPWLAAGLLVALVSILPFAPGLLSGRSFYFRDLGHQYFPMRAFAMEGLRQGELRYWNPFVHEGEPIVPPLGYPLDLPQILFDDEHGLSWILALHVPLAALAALALARGLGLSPLAASGVALVYALGGFMLSGLNLFLHLQAGAWAPLVVLSLMRAAVGGSRAWVLAALVTAVSLSSLGVEITGQAVLLGGVIALSRKGLPRQLAGVGVALALAAGLTAPVLLVVKELATQGARAGGLPADMVLAFSVHPVALLQVVVAGLFGVIPTALRSFWGHRFFSGFPYFLSLYLGAATLCVALVGMLHRGSASVVRKVAALSLLGLVISLGPVAGLGALLELFPFLAALRFPSKAFFLVHFGVALLFGWGVQALQESDSERAWRRLALVGCGLGAALLAVSLLPPLLPAATDELSRSFFPEAYSMARRHNALGLLLRDATLGGLVSLLVGLVSFGSLRGLPSRRLAAPVIVALVAADLLRAGAPLNPMLDSSVWEPSPESRQVAEQVRARGGRLFTCDPSSSRQLFELLNTTKRRDDVLSLAASVETLVPYHNLELRLPTAYSRDTSGFLSEKHALTPAELGCARFAELVGPLRRAGVSHVLTLDPQTAPGVSLDRVLYLSSLERLPAALLRIADPLPLRQVARQVRPAASAAEAETIVSEEGFQREGGTAVEGFDVEVRGAQGRVTSLEEQPDHLELEVEADRGTVVVVRDTFAEGWQATVDGVPAPVLRADGRHRAVPVPAGRSRVSLTYHPPGLRTGCGLGLASLLIALGLCYWPLAPLRRM